MGDLDRKSLLLLTGGCAVAAFGVWLGSIAGGFWALALVGLSVCGVVALGLRGLLHRLSGQTLMVDGILLVGILACLSLEQSALVVNMVFAALAVFLCADVAAWFRQWRGSLSDGAVADAGRGVVASFVAQLVLGVALLLGVGVVAFASGVGPWRWPLAVVLSLLCVCLLAVVVRPRSAGGVLRRELRVGLELDLAFMAITLYAFCCSDFQPGHWLPLWLAALDVLFFASDIARWRLDRTARI
ncbi:hypothetical protein [Marseilla massiliensis]|uniref:hypothetical protein n=1 Tax=Marseilla massiliensis TaxID=1841864 RepID=UPI0020120C72|nr:hypothetical protein [Marseilla massiliensis]MCL1609217.1 hypothetical protein [Marseilla massiliensis]